MSIPSKQEIGRRPHEVYRLGAGEELAAICGYVAMKAVHYPGCEVRRTDFPPKDAPRLNLFSPVAFSGISTPLPKSFLKSPEVQQTIINDVPSLKKAFAVSSTGVKIYKPPHKKYKLLYLELSEEDNERFMQEQLDLYHSIGRLARLSDSEVAKLPTYAPTIGLLGVPRGTMPSNKLSQLEEALADLSTANFTVRPADFPKGNTRQPVQKTRQSTQELEAMIQASRRIQTHQSKPKQRGRR